MTLDAVLYIWCWVCSNLCLLFIYFKLAEIAKHQHPITEDFKKDMPEREYVKDRLESLAFEIKAVKQSLKSCELQVRQTQNSVMAIKEYPKR